MPFRAFREFIKLESSAGILLFCAAILALVVDNSSWHPYYEAFFSLPLSFQVGQFHLSKPLLLWVNDGLMALFFLLVGLEIKREFLVGELRSVKRATLPAIAALGGMVMPAIVYLFFNHHDPLLSRGWAIPMATDIAFSLGVLALLGSRIPLPLKVFLTAVAIFDDLGAIIVIAVFYTEKISLVMLLIATICCLVLLLLNRMNVVRTTAYFIVGAVLWLCVLKSGVHATLAGIVVGFAIPLEKRGHPRIRPLQTIEHALHPWVAFCILPIFAFANAGVSFRGLELADLYSPMPLGIILGLFFGKQLGIWGFSMTAIKLGLAEMPRKVSSLSLYGTAALAGIGFTMSLFIATLAYGDTDPAFAPLVRFGVLVGSLLSGILGYFILHRLHPVVGTGNVTKG